MVVIRAEAIGRECYHRVSVSARSYDRQAMDRCRPEPSIAPPPGWRACQPISFPIVSTLAGRPSSNLALTAASSNRSW